MFFEMHEENQIGYKELSDADLGRSEDSHQTHIGLFDDVLTFLSNEVKIKDAMVIYNETLEMLPLYFKRIKSANGTYRSPRIHAGSRGRDSVLSFIRRTVRNVDADGTWYLFWFGLKSEQPVFLLVEKDSKIFRELCSLEIPFPEQVRSRFTSDDLVFNRLINYLEDIVNISGVSFAEELELITQTDRRKPRNIRKYNFEKACAKAKKVGHEGELLINDFFDYQKSIGEISDYQWTNGDGESGFPYDFMIEHLDGEREYLDVKTTDYRFEQQMIFSSQEIEFAFNHAENYSVYRVYCRRDGARFLRICNDTKGLFADIHTKINEFKSDLVDTADIHSLKLAISPCHEAFVVSEAIAL